MLKKYFYIFSFIPLLAISQTTTVSSNNNVVGLEHNMLFNAHTRFKVSQSGPTVALPMLFDGSFSPFYTNQGVSDSNPLVITIEDLPAYHTQIGAWIGWSTRYYYATKFKIEGYDQYNNHNAWVTFADYSSSNYNSNVFIEKVPQSGTYTKLRFTFYASDQPTHFLGISELFFLHPEGVKPYEGLMGNLNSGNQAIWEKQGNQATYALGNVGIGISNPQNKLDVNGTVHAKEIKVDMSGWADFVFHKDYHLPTLDEVEKYINEKGHLPNIPSTKEVTENGLSLGENHKLLLQKIEELTLYQIQLNKEVRNLRQENRLLKETMKKNKHRP